MAPVGGEESGRGVSAAATLLAHLVVDYVCTYLMGDVWVRREGTCQFVTWLVNVSGAG